MHTDIHPDLVEINNLRLSLAEEMQAVMDYKCRALCTKDKAERKLYEHLASEEANHFAQLLVALTEKCTLLEEVLVVHYLGKD